MTACSAIITMYEYMKRIFEMKTLYIDCTAGVSGDMLLNALAEIAGEEIRVPEIDHDRRHDRDHHGRSYRAVQRIIGHMADAGISETARQYALNIYAILAKAEASVHGMSLETVHFHEVGRDRAVRNALGIGMALEKLGFDPMPAKSAGRIVVSPIYDGQGFVDCAHGRIPVPVPAVSAMMDECGESKGPGHGYEFRTAEEVDTEMVTPSGLAAVMGIGAEPAEKGFAVMGSITAEAQAEGTRDTGRGGLRVYLIEGATANEEE